MSDWRTPVVSNGNDMRSAVTRSRFKLILSLLVLLLGTALASSVLAQASNENAATPTQPPPSPQPTRPTRRRPTLDDHVKALATSLDLSEQQQLAVKKILEQRQMETLRLRRDTAIEGNERIARLRALQDQTVERIRSILTDDQKKKYDPLAVRQIAPQRDQKSIDDFLKAPPPK